jgi:hypothetical protein
MLSRFFRRAQKTQSETYAEKVWEGPIDEGAIKIWAYDDHLVLTEQDEDLILYDPDFVAPLIGLAEDEDCLKGPYILSVLGHYFDDIVVRGRDDPGIIVRGGQLAARSTNDEVRRWGEYQLVRHSGVTPRVR